MTPEEFKAVFRSLTGNSPMTWQTRLFGALVQGEIPSVIDLPTGLGKTMVIPIWLIARLKNPSLGTRLAYIVDRRTVVDQASILCEKIIEKFPTSGLSGECPSVSTLRGQFADNREWTKDPSRPAIIIGTVDMIGSRLLFSGYGCSSKQRSIHAALLGHDSLVLLDEAHLSPAFAKLLARIKATQEGIDKSLQRPLVREPRSIDVVTMSATLERDTNVAAVFSLTEEDHADQTIEQRINATKRLFIHAADDVRVGIIHHAKLLADRNQRLIIFVRTPDQVQKIADALRKAGIKLVEMLTGTMRGKEREAQIKDGVKHPVFGRLLTPIDPDPTCPAILVATAAGEVGVDFNADHLVCDVTPIDSMIQRLGRVNRRGIGVAEVHLIASSKPEKSPKPFDHSCDATLSLLTVIPTADDGSRDVSPIALRRLSVASDAMSPKPETVPLTEFLLDAWSMTSIRPTLPGRPNVDPWLRGVDENETPHTVLAWRMELDHLGKNTDAVAQSFDDYPLKSHELLRERSDIVAQRFLSIPENHHGKLVAVIGVDILLLPLGKLVRRNKDSLVRFLKDRTVVLPASVGGIEDGHFSGNWHATSVGDGSADVADIFGERHRDWVTTHELEPNLPANLTCVEDFDEDAYVLKRAFDLKMRFVSSISVPPREAAEEPHEWFVYFEADVDDNRNWTKVKQSLENHVKAVVTNVQSTVAKLSLDLELSEAIELAAMYHDSGKERDLWQAYARREDGDLLLGKSNRYLNPQILSGFRHEFGSLVDATLNPRISQHKHRELILHLIASHHGHGRPHFDTAIDPGASPDVNPDAVAAAVPLRFANLQRQYGRWGLAWIEAILRCADQRASAEVAE